MERSGCQRGYLFTPTKQSSPASVLDEICKIEFRSRTSRSFCLQLILAVDIVPKIKPPELCLPKQSYKSKPCQFKAFDQGQRPKTFKKNQHPKRPKNKTQALKKLPQNEPTNQNNINRPNQRCWAMWRVHALDPPPRFQSPSALGPNGALSAPGDDHSGPGAECPQNPIENGYDGGRCHIGFYRCFVVAILVLLHCR